MEILSNGDGTYAIYINENEFEITRQQLDDFMSQAQCIIEDEL